MKKLISLAIIVAMLFMLSITALANPGQNPNQNPGSPQAEAGGVTITVTGGGNNLVILAICNDTGNSVIVPRTGNGTFTQTFAAHGYEGIIQVQGNSLRSVTITKTPYVCEDICEDCGVCTNCGECECGELADLVVVNLGFIGYYINNGTVMSTSIHWQNLEKGDMIDWDAVDAAYADWIARGGLAPDRATGWITSGFGSFTFADYDALGFGDFTPAQLESFYLAYYVDPGFVPPYVCGNICEDCGVCLDCGECECEEGGFDGIPANKGCENCEGNAAAYRCDGSGCAGNGKGAPGGNQGGGNQGGNQQ